MKSNWLLDHKRDVHSTTGDDGIIERILQTLPTRNRWCVEFGAWDGVFESNTRSLIDTDGCSAVLIEADPARFQDLQRRCQADPRVIAIHATVGWSGKEALDALLAPTPVPADLDFLSIDIDGNDYHVWDALQRYRPKLVCIEFNPTIATGVRFVQRRDHAVSQGCSLSSLVDLGKAKGYELVAATLVNAFFVDAEHFPLFEIDDNRPEVLRETEERVTHLIVGYDGSIHLAGYRRLRWHGLEMRESRVQQMPRFLRTYPQRYSRMQAFVMRTLTRIRWLTATPRT